MSDAITFDAAVVADAGISVTGGLSSAADFNATTLTYTGTTPNLVLGNPAAGNLSVSGASTNVDSLSPVVFTTEGVLEQFTVSSDKTTLIPAIAGLYRIAVSIASAGGLSICVDGAPIPGGQIMYPAASTGNAPTTVVATAYVAAGSLIQVLNSNFVPSTITSCSLSVTFAGVAPAS